MRRHSGRETVLDLAARTLAAEIDRLNSALLFIAATACQAEHGEIPAGEAVATIRTLARAAMRGDRAAAASPQQCREGART